jgi:hypothetical protein
MMFLLLSRLVGRTQREYPLVRHSGSLEEDSFHRESIYPSGRLLQEPKQGMPLVCATWLVRRELLGNAPLAMRVPLP